MVTLIRLGLLNRSSKMLPVRFQIQLHKLIWGADRTGFRCSYALASVLLPRRYWPLMSPQADAMDGAPRKVEGRYCAPSIARSARSTYRTQCALPLATLVDAEPLLAYARRAEFYVGRRPT